ncbi:hypothetical protein GGU11DRAFT_858414, partial [Lentinula aff. detonsa]
SDPLQNTVQLNNQLRSLGLYAAPTIGDGNCLFRALSDQYYGSPSRYGEVRREICDFIEAHPEQYEGFVDVDEFGDSSVRKGKGSGLSVYVAGMRQNATYGGHMELSAFAHLVKRNIKVVQPGLVYVIQWDPSQPKSPKSSSKKAGDSPARYTRSSSSRELGDGDALITPGEDQDSTIYVAYHDWEHFSSVRNLRGPHTGIPRVYETVPPPTAAGVSPLSSLPPSPTEELDGLLDAATIPLPTSAPPSVATSPPTPICLPSNPSAVAIDPLSNLSHLTHLVPPPRIQRSPKRSFEESVGEEGSAESAISNSSVDSKRSRIGDVSSGATESRGRQGHRSQQAEDSPEPAETGALPSLKDDDPESADSDDGHHTGEEALQNGLPDACAYSERPLTRRQRKKLGLPKARNVSVSGKGIGKIIIPGGKAIKQSRDASSAAEWTANGNGRVDVRGFRELKI